MVGDVPCGCGRLETRLALYVSQDFIWTVWCVDQWGGSAATGECNPWANPTRPPDDAFSLGTLHGITSKLLLLLYLCSYNGRCCIELPCSTCLCGRILLAFLGQIADYHTAGFHVSVAIRGPHLDHRVGGIRRGY
jgi:hypothetical protein